jgi:hypothetical protein
MAAQAPAGLVAIHPNLAATAPPALVQGFTTGDPPAGLSEEERGAYQQLRGFYATHVAYANIMATGPQTLDGLADSPLQLAAFLLDHGDGTGQPGLVTQVLAGTLQRELTRDDLLDNLTLSWLTTTGVSAARLSWENSAGFFDAKAITIPFAISGFPHELYQAPGSWAERAHPGQPPLLQQQGRPRRPLRGLGATPAAGPRAPGRLPAPALNRSAHGPATPTTAGAATAVLVHGAVADAASWSGVIQRLQATGVRSPPRPIPCAAWPPTPPPPPASPPSSTVRSGVRDLTVGLTVRWVGGCSSRPGGSVVDAWCCTRPG